MIVPYVPPWKKKQSQTPFYEYEAEYSTSPVVSARKGGGILDNLKDKKKFEYIMEAFDKLKGPTVPPLAAGSNVGASGIQYTPTDMGAYVGDPVARQTAMAKARMEEELQRRKKLLGGGY